MQGHLQAGQNAGLLGVGGEAPGAGDAAEALGLTVEGVSDPHHAAHLTPRWQTHTHAHTQGVSMSRSRRRKKRTRRRSRRRREKVQDTGGGKRTVGGGE